MREREISEKHHEYTRRQTFLLHVLVGAVIGLGGVLPGVSGGVMAVSLGLYRPMIEAVAGFFKAPKKNFLFLLPVGVGAALGFLLGAVVLSGVMERWYVQVTWLFLGLVAGGIPSFIKEANQRGFKWRYLLMTVLGAALAACLLMLKNGAEEVRNVESLTPLTALISGAVVAVGTVFPGVSTSFILMYLGWYKAMMDAFANVEVLTIIMLGIGAAACILCTIKAARWLFERFHGYAYYAVLGFLIVAAALIVPEISASWVMAVNAAIAVIGAAAGYLLGRLEM